MKLICPAIVQRVASNGILLVQHERHLRNNGSRERPRELFGVCGEDFRDVTSTALPRRAGQRHPKLGIKIGNVVDWVLVLKSIDSSSTTEIVCALAKGPLSGRGRSGSRSARAIGLVVKTTAPGGFRSAAGKPNTSL